MKMSLDYFTDLLLTEGLSQELKPKQWMLDVPLILPQVDNIWILFAKKKSVINTHRIYIVSLPNVVSSICQLN